MKKVLCIMIAMVVAFSAFAMTSSAKAADAGLELLKTAINDRSLTIKLDDRTFDRKVTDVTASFKLPQAGDKTTGVAVAGHAKILNLDADVILKGQELNGYFAIFKVNATELINYVDAKLGAQIDSTLNFDEISEEIDKVFEKLNPKYLDFLYKRASTEYPSLQQLGNVKVDFYAVDYIELANFINTTAGYTVIPSTPEPTSTIIKTAIDAINDQTIKDKFTAVGIPLEAIKALIIYDENLQSTYKFGTLSDDINAILKMYYKDNGKKLIGIAVNLPDGSAMSTEINTVNILNEMDIKVEEITAPADESAFNAPFVAIDITGIVKWIFSLVATSFA